MKYICPNFNLTFCTNEECSHGKPHEHTPLCNVSFEKYGEAEELRGVCPECVPIEISNFIEEGEMNL